MLCPTWLDAVSSLLPPPRYWIAGTYAQRHQEGQEPENVDKEFLRLWFASNCDPYSDGTLPDAPAELVVELARRYIYLYQRITG